MNGFSISNDADRNVVLNRSIRFSRIRGGYEKKNRQITYTQKKILHDQNNDLIDLQGLWKFDEMITMIV